MSLTGGQPNVAQSLAVSCAGTLCTRIHFWGLLPRDRILPRAKFTLRPSLAFSYIDSVTAWHSSSRPQPNFAAWYKEWNYGTFAEGATYIQLGDHHAGHQPTFYLCLFCVVVHFYWRMCAFVVLGSVFTIPSQETGLGNVSKMTFFVSSGT